MPQARVPSREISTVKVGYEEDSYTRLGQGEGNSLSGLPK